MDHLTQIQPITIYGLYNICHPSIKYGIKDIKGVIFIHRYFQATEV